LLCNVLHLKSTPKFPTIKNRKENRRYFPAPAPSPNWNNACQRARASAYFLPFS
jgi:hypothetical protein